MESVYMDTPQPEDNMLKLDEEFEREYYRKLDLLMGRMTEKRTICTICRSLKFTMTNQQTVQL